MNKVVKIGVSKLTGTPLTGKLAYAEYLRENCTESEFILNDELTKAGYTFEFQAVVHGYIPDFYFSTVAKIVELDGKRFHNAEQDRVRDGHLRAKGIQILRIQSHRVFDELPNVMRSIEIFIKGSSKASYKRVKRTVRKQRQRNRLR